MKPKKIKVGMVLRNPRHKDDRHDIRVIAGSLWYSFGIEAYRVRSIRTGRTRVEAEPYLLTFDLIEDGKPALEGNDG